MLSLTKRRDRHGILAGNENRILGRSACPVFAPHRGLRQKNAALMAKMKNRITEKGLWQENTTIWAVPWDNPQTTPPHLCRYDVCTQGLLNLPVQTLPGGKYLIFILPHTTEALAQAWAGCFDAAAAQGYTIDFRRPIMERYVKKEVDRHRCDLCLPITS